MPRVEVVAYDEGWPKLFEEIRGVVWPAVQLAALRMEHVGSTAVPGLSAKPVIDATIVVASPRDVPFVVKGLASIGYTHRGTLGVPERDAFRRPAGMPRHHLYASPRNALSLRNQLGVRDYLRAHPDAAKEYGELKTDPGAPLPRGHRQLHRREDRLHHRHTAAARVQAARAFRDRGHQHTRQLAQMNRLVIAAALFASQSALAQDSDSAERAAAREWFRDARFGMFVHWGVYSQLGAGEWVMEQRGIPIPSYEWLASAFNPVKFDAREWVSLAKAAGVRYITITSRHHDGFSMFATKVTPYNIVDATPFKRDPMAELAAECRRQGIKLFFYYSQLDWHHPDYFPRGNTGARAGRADAGDWPKYLDFMERQLAELLTNYGPIGGIWFDGMWDKPTAEWQLPRTYALIHRLQPSALIIPNHHRAPMPGEDVQTFEQDLPGANTTGYRKDAGVSDLPLETSLTMNGSWGFNITDRNFKSTRELIGYLVRASGYGANLLLNIGPRPDGTIQPEAADRLREIGEWLSTYGPSIYGTRSGPIAPRDWGATTRRGDTVFVHVLKWPDRVLSLPDVGGRVVRARMFASGEAVPFTQAAGGLTLTLPPAGTEPDRVVTLILSR